MRFWDYDEMSRCHAQSFNKKALCLISVLSRSFLLPPLHIMQPISGSPKVQIKGDWGTRSQQGEKNECLFICIWSHSKVCVCVWVCVCVCERERERERKREWVGRCACLSFQMPPLPPLLALFPKKPTEMCCIEMCCIKGLLCT